MRVHFPVMRNSSLTLALAAVTVLTGNTILAGPQATTQKKADQSPAARTSRPSPIESIRKHLQRLGESIDESKSTPEMIVSSYEDPKRGRVAIVILYDKSKELTGFYVYNFGNLNNAPNPAAVERYLLEANDHMSIGAFFVDGQNDVGYKYLIPAGPITLPAFESIYLNMASAALERRPQIRRLIEGEHPRDKSRG